MRLALACLLISGTSAYANIIPADYESLNKPPPELVVANPFIKIGGEQIKGVRYSIDGVRYQTSCTRDDRNSDGKTCGTPVVIDPGPHIVSVVLCTDPDCAPTGETWRAQLRIVVGLRERVTIDLDKLMRNEKSVSRTSVGSAPQQSSCAVAIEKTLYANTCDAAGMRDFKTKLVAMDAACRSSWTKQSDLLLEFAVWQVLHLEPTACYTSDELRKVPPFVAEGASGTFWPRGTLTAGTSSWEWARSVRDRAMFDKLQGSALRTKVMALMDEWIERQTVVDHIVAVVLDPRKNLNALVSAASSEPGDIDPRTPAGHRMYALVVLVAGDWIVSDATLEQVLAKSGQGNTRIHCAYEPEAKELVRAYLADKSLSREEWSAIAAIVKRTPTDESLSGCAGAFTSSVASPVSQEARLVLLGEIDCASNRDEKVRGRTISQALDGDQNTAPRALRVKLMRKFADCVGF